jgi:hypothetical protein
VESWVGCIAGALEEGEYRSLLTAAGFDAIDIDITRVYNPDDLVSTGGCCGSTQVAGS